MVKTVVRNFTNFFFYFTNLIVYCFQLFILHGLGTLRNIRQNFPYNNGWFVEEGNHREGLVSAKWSSH